MSYVLYSAIARAGGIDLLLSQESFARPRPARRRQGASIFRRQGGKALIGLGQALTRWGRRWAPQTQIAAANSNLSFAAE